MVKTLENFASNRLIQCGHIHHHPRLPVHRAARQYLHNVIVPVAVGIVAFSICRPVLLGRERIALQPMAGAEHIPAAKIGSHASPLYSAKISGVS